MFAKVEVVLVFGYPHREVFEATNFNPQRRIMAEKSMSTQKVVVIALLLALVTFIIWSYFRMNKQKDQTASTSVTASGLEEIGVKLAPAYPQRSWREMILSNESDHHIIAVVMVYEVTREDNEKISLGHVIALPELSLENDPVRIRAFLEKHPIIPPHSKWLVGLGVENKRLTDTLPTFEEAQSSTFMQDVTLTPKALKSVHITLDGVILENGQTVGPQTRNTRQVISDNLPLKPGEPK
ncbi:MAG: hypothetical protein ACREEM_12405 [Blastocatellia bacterium]